MPENNDEAKLDIAGAENYSDGDDNGEVLEDSLFH